MEDGEAVDPEDPDERRREQGIGPGLGEEDLPVRAPA